jgi:hypothetical protein
MLDGRFGMELLERLGGWASSGRMREAGRRFLAVSKRIWEAGIKQQQQQQQQRAPSPQRSKSKIFSI